MEGKLAVIYFSPTHTSRTTALAVAAMACGWLVIMLLFHLGMGRQK